MYRKVFLFSVFLLVLTQVAQAQKVKYKDLIELLNVKQYEKAEPFLKRYLREETDNASAYLYMGIIYQDKSLRNDILKENDLLVNNLDSALFFYEKVYPLITEREIKRNKDNYQMFNRRDVRTGEFGVSHSDVQLQIEDRIKAVKQRRDNVSSLKKSFDQSQAQYKRAQQFFKTIQSQYESERELLMKSPEQLLVELNNLILVFDSSQLSFKSYKALLQASGKSPYNQEVNLQFIKEFKKDGTGDVDFYQNELKFWNYGTWAHNTGEVIQKEIYPLRESLIKADIEINDQYKKVKGDTSVAKALPGLSKKIEFKRLLEIDPSPLPISVFRVKIAELAYLSKVIDDKKLRDSSDVSMRMKALRTDIKMAITLDSLASLAAARDLDKDAQLYTHFISHAYGSQAVLKSWLKAIKEFSHREVTQRELQWEETIQSLKWVFAGSDSIPLFVDENSKRPYKPLFIGSDQMTMGLKYVADTVVTGYFYSILPSRTPDMSIAFPVDTINFNQRNLPLIKGTLIANTNQSYFAMIYLESKQTDGFPVTISRINRNGGLGWSINYMFEAKPEEFKYLPNGELSIKIGTGDAAKIIAIDPAGKRLQ